MEFTWRPLPGSSLARLLRPSDCRDVGSRLWSGRVTVAAVSADRYSAIGASRTATQFLSPRRRLKLSLGSSILRKAGEILPGSIPISHAVLKLQLASKPVWGGDHAAVPRRQQWVARFALLRVIITPRPASAVTPRLHRRRGGHRYRSLAGQHAGLACRRIGGSVFGPCSQADD